MSGKRKSDQGRSLPVDGSALESYPIGCCVLIVPAGRVRDDQPTPGDPQWHIIAFRIGKVGSPHLRRLTNPPTSLTWNCGTGPALETRGSAVVLKSCWPERKSDHVASEDDHDPLLLGVRIIQESEMGFK